MGCTAAAAGRFAVELPKFLLETSVPAAGNGAVAIAGASDGGKLLLDLCSSVLVARSTDRSSLWVTQDLMAAALRQPRRWSAPLALFTPGNASEPLQIVDMAHTRDGIVLLESDGVYIVPATMHSDAVATR